MDILKDFSREDRVARVYKEELPPLIRQRLSFFQLFVIPHASCHSIATRRRLSRSSYGMNDEKEKDKMNSTRPIARSVRAKQMVPEAAYVPLGVQRIIRLFSFYVTARANDILRLRALVTVSIVPYNIYNK